MICCHEMWYRTTKTRFLASLPLRTQLLLYYMTVSCKTLTWHICGGRVLQKVNTNLLGLSRIFEYGHPLVCFKNWQYKYLNIGVLKTYYSRFLTIFQSHLTCFWRFLFFVANFDSLRKPCFSSYLCLFWNNKSWKFF